MKTARVFSITVRNACGASAAPSAWALMLLSSNMGTARTRVRPRAPSTRDSGGPGERPVHIASDRTHYRGETLMRSNHGNEQGIIKYGIAWLLGVPVSLLIVIFVLARAC